MVSKSTFEGPPLSSSTGNLLPPKSASCHCMADMAACLRIFNWI